MGRERVYQTQENNRGRARIVWHPTARFNPSGYFMILSVHLNLGHKLFITALMYFIIFLRISMNMYYFGNSLEYI